MGIGDFAQGTADVAFTCIGATDSESIRTPDFSFGATMSIIACMIEGTPAMTMTLPILKPGARMVRALDQFGAVGNPAMRSRASFRSAAPQRSRNPRHHFRMMVDADAERFRDAVGGDVVMGRPDAAVVNT